jgi:tight adherence protein B
MTDFRVFQFSKKQKVRLYILFGLLGGILSLLFYQNIIFGVIIIPFFPKLRSFVEEKYSERRRREYLVQFKDFLFIAATSIGAGRSMKDAIREAIPRLVDIYDEDAILIRELNCVYHRISHGNEDDLDVLMDLALLSNQEDVVDFVTIYASCKVTGASLIRAMNQAAMVIIDKMTIEREIKELIRRKEQEGLIILASPILVILFLNLAAPDYIAPLYETIRGRIIMTGVIASTIGVYELIQRIVKVSV